MPQRPRSSPHRNTRTARAAFPRQAAGDDHRPRPGTALFAGIGHRVWGMLVLVLLGAIIVVLFLGGLKAFHAFGLGFLTEHATGTRPQDRLRRCGHRGLRHPRHARCWRLLMSVPLAFGIAFFLTETCPRNGLKPTHRQPRWSCSRRCPPSSSACGGFSSSCRSWPTYVQPWVIRQLRGLAAASACCSPGRRSAPGILTAALILAVMIIPFIAATMRDVFQTVPVDVQGVGVWPWLHAPGR